MLTINPKLTYIPLMLLFLSRVSMAEPSEIGYERWTPTNIASGIVLAQPPEWYYKAYADQMHIANQNIEKPKNPYRLIDIEMTGDAENGYLMDAVWVANEGDFETSSWMMHGLTGYDVLSMEAFDDIVVLDIETYEPVWGVPTKYAMIVKQNPNKFEFKILLNIMKDYLLSEISSGEWRPIDVDILYNKVGAPSDPLVWKNVRYNAILVKNTGGNFKMTRLLENEGPEDIDSAALDGLQLIDMEPVRNCVAYDDACPSPYIICGEPMCVAGTEYLSLYVSNGLPFHLDPLVPADDISSVSQQWGRSIDIESMNLMDEKLPDGVASVFVP